MKYSILKYITVFSIILSLSQLSLNACSCKNKSIPDIMDLNDSELIFTATLLKYEIGMAAGSLQFMPKYKYKGTLEDTITIYFQPQNAHLVFNKDVKFQENQDWIVFARIKTKGERKYYRLIETDGSNFCALSRPVKKNQEKDEYLDFLAQNGNQPDGFKKFFNGEKELSAEGFFINNAPSMEWKYYHSGGKPNISGEYKSGKREGEWLKYTTNSKGETTVIQKRYYNQGVLTEIQDLRYSGTISFKKILTDTTEIRHYLNEDETINSIVHRNKDDDSMKAIIYHENGLIKEEKYFEENKLIYRYEYNENGQKVVEWVKKD